MTKQDPPLREAVPGKRLVRAYLKGGSDRSSDTGGRKYFGRSVIERYQRMGESGQSQFDPADLTEFRPRFDSPPYPVSDMLLVERSALSGSGEADLSFEVGGRVYSSPVIPGEASWGAEQMQVHDVLGALALRMNFIFGIGEGGVAPPLKGNPNIMVQVATGLFGVGPDMLRDACIVSVKMSQSAKIGMGGHLPKEKVTPQIAQARGMPLGVDILSDASRVFSIEEMRALVQAIKHVTGKPVFVKVGASHSIAHVAAGAARAGADGILIDGLGGGTGAAPHVHRDHIGMPVELAVRLAHLQIESIGMRDRFRIIAGGRVDLPPKAFKLMLLGADGVMMGTGALIALGCKVVNNCHQNCPVALTAVKALPDGSRQKELDTVWAGSVFERFYSAFNAELASLIGACGFGAPREARGRIDILRAHGMPGSLAKLLGVPESRSIHPVPGQSLSKYYSGLLEHLAETGRPKIGSMGRTTDLDPPFSNLDLLTHEGRTVVGPAYDSHRETIETMVRLPGNVNISMPVILADGGPLTTRLAREKNTVILTDPSVGPPRDTKRRIIPLSPGSLRASIYAMRESSGVMLAPMDATEMFIREIRTLSPSTAVYTMIDASVDIGRDAIALASAGADAIIIRGSLSMADPAPIDIAISQADSALSEEMHGGSILRRKTMLIASADIRTSRDIYALNCLGADAVVCDTGKLISDPTFERQLNLLGGLGAELRQLMGASGLSMMSSIIGNRNILRADHYLGKDAADFLGVDYIGV
ncbi:MAG: glutamate synthase-related protein [Candidatus Micrarchaeia archaeon]